MCRIHQSDLSLVLGFQMEKERKEAFHLLQRLRIAHPSVYLSANSTSRSLEQTERKRQQRMASNLVCNRHDRREIGDFPGPGSETRQVDHAAGDWDDESILGWC